MYETGAGRGNRTPNLTLTGPKCWNQTNSSGAVDEPPVLVCSHYTNLRRRLLYRWAIPAWITHNYWGTRNLTAIFVELAIHVWLRISVYTLVAPTGVEPILQEWKSCVLAIRRRDHMATSGGFEPPEDLYPQRISNPPQSTTLPRSQRKEVTAFMCGQTHE